MGKHWVPRFYLRFFSNDSERQNIFQFDRDRSCSSSLPIDKVAQAKDYYDQTVESKLTEAIEKPGNEVLAKLSVTTKITDHEKTALSVYIGTLTKRVPKFRNEKVEDLRKFVPEEIRRLHGFLSRAIETNFGDDTEIRADLEKKISGVERLAKEDLVKNFLHPFPTKELVNAINTMDWQFLRSESRDSFITSDNPIIIGSGIGLVFSDANLIFPISPRLTLLCNRKKQLGEIKVSQKTVGLINKCTLGNSDRFVYYGREEKWIAKEDLWAKRKAEVGAYSPVSPSS